MCGNFRSELCRKKSRTILCLSQLVPVGLRTDKVDPLCAKNQTNQIILLCLCKNIFKKRQWPLGDTKQMPGKEACYRRRDTRSTVQPSGKHLCREGAGCPGGQQIDHKPAMIFWDKDQQHSATQYEKCWQQVIGSDPSPVVSSGEIGSVSHWAFQNKIDMGILEQASSIVEWRFLRDLAYEEGLREMVLFSLKRRLRRILSMHINTWWENVKKRETGLQWYLMKGQETTNTNCRTGNYT